MQLLGMKEMNDFLIDVFMSEISWKCTFSWSICWLILQFWYLKLLENAFFLRKQTYDLLINIVVLKQIYVTFCKITWDIKNEIEIMNQIDIEFQF